MTNGRLSNWLMWLRQPSRQAAGIVLGVGFVAGGLALIGGHAVVESSSTLGFCISCHEMRDFVYQEYKTSIHYRNPAGVRAGCPDCHVPKPYIAKLLRKARATVSEIPAKVMGTIDTREKFEAKRLELAESVWAEMRGNNSRECRNCHDEAAMLLDKQRPRARAQHEDALKTGQTCIECHQGIAHKKPVKPPEQGEQNEDFSL